MIIPQEIISFNNDVRVWYAKYCNLKNLTHWHEETELIYIHKGNVNVAVNGTTYHGTTDDCFLCTGGDIHSINSEDNSIVSALIFGSNIIGNLKRYMPKNPKIENHLCVTKELNMIISEMKSKHPFYLNAIYNHINSIMIELYRKNEYIEYSGATKHSTMLGKYQELIDYIDKNFAEITFDEACAVMALTPAYFSKVFSDICGISFTQYLNNIKIEKSIEKIRAGEKSITEIAFECGFLSIRNYNRVFKKLTGFTPKKIPDDYIFDLKPSRILASNFNPTLAETKIIREYI